MLLSSLVPLLSLSLPLCLAATQKQQAQTPRERLAGLAAEDNGMLHLDDELYNVITAPNRNWSATLQFTVLQSFRCAPCKELEPNFRALAKAWSTVPAADRDDHFFATIDYDDSKETFKKLGINAAPVIRLYPPAKGPRMPASGRADALTFDFGESRFDPAMLAVELSRFTPVPIPYRAPPNYALFATVAFSLLALLVLARFILPIITSRWTWAIFSIGTSLVMLGGYMFVRIRGMPYVAGEHGTELISHGFQTQYGIEVQIIAFLYGVLALGFVALTLVVPRQASAASQRYSVYVWTGVSITLFSILVSIFKLKNGGYPFRLLL